ncbi:LysM peptidoglycan-binding domain-containing protein [Sporosarcina sp. UB5]|uniref:LysM peptidoglycan-binding domain-containing protein n=1 Tax=Sporosarcina sp. UB5 TaxID=3047463 RepID=UPI003D7AB7F7
MKNNDYKVEFENNRKEIELDQSEGSSLPSRTERHGRRRQQKKTSRYTTINVILGIFTFIPILIFVYVIYNFYFGSDRGSAKVDNSDNTVVYGTNVSSGNSDKPGLVLDDSDKEKEDEGQSNGNANKVTVEDSKVESEKTTVGSNPPADDKNGNLNETKTDKTEEKPDTEDKSDDMKSRTHIVSANETLYRISMNYYGSDAGIEKIKKANGLSSNNIMAGQKLIIP